MYRILHLSDLHARESTKWSTLPILRQAKEVILESANKKNFDIIAFTGDIAFSGKKEEYAIAQEWLDDLCLKPSGLNMDKGQILLVPGNHDIDRGLIGPASDAIQDKLATARSQATVAQYYGNTESLALLLKRQASYFEFCRSFLGTDAKASQCWSRTFRATFGRIRIDGLNTSWLCRGDSDHRQLLVSQSQLAEVSDSATDADLCIALMHHPLADLMEFDEVNTSDYLKQNADIVLRGHLHRAEGAAHSTNTGGYLELSAGSLHETHESPNRFSILDISDDLGEVRVSTFLWQSGRWILDRNLYQTEDGVGTFSINQRGAAGGTLAKTIPPLKRLVVNPKDDPVQLQDDTEPADSPNAQLNLPRFQYVPTPQDLCIRQRELEDAVAHLRSRRRLVIQKDPGSKHEGFLASIIGELHRSGVEAPPPAFHLRCTGVANGRELQTSIELAAGCSMTLLGNSLRESAGCLLIFDDLDFPATQDNTAGPTIDGTLDALHDFCPQTMVVRVTALPCPPEKSPLRIGSLDLPDVRSYLTKAPRPVELSSSTDYARVHRITGGVPVYLDEFIAALSVADLESALSQVSSQPAVSTSSLHKAVVEEIRELQNSTSDDMQRTRSLLWTLAILEQGESLNAIKRLDGQAPIWPKYANYLESRGCLESVAMSSRFGAPAQRFGTTEGDKILRIPRLVRDYVLSIMPPADRDQIIRNVAKLYFSDDWRFGTVRMRRRLAIGSEISSHQSGNELAVLKCLLQSPSTYFGGTSAHAFDLALNYVSQLEAKGLYGEAYEAAKDILAIVESMQRVYETENVYFIRLSAASCARMVGEWETCVEYLTAALPSVRQSKVKSVLTDALVDYAFALRSMGRDAEAKLAADEVLEIAPKESSDYFQAKAILAQINMGREDAIKYLKPLATRARNLKHFTVADNIVLWIVADTDDSEEKLKLLAQVKYRRELDINFVRATLYRIETLLDMNRQSELTLVDRNDLMTSYQLAYSQRLSLFDWCHRVYWRYVAMSRDSVWLAELYMYSSFVWRLNGDASNELKYSLLLQQEALGGLTIVAIPNISGYLVRRIAALRKQ